MESIKKTISKQILSTSISLLIGSMATFTLVAIRDHHTISTLADAVDKVERDLQQNYCRNETITGVVQDIVEIKSDVKDIRQALITK